MKEQYIKDRDKKLKKRKELYSKYTHVNTKIKDRVIKENEYNSRTWKQRIPYKDEPGKVPVVKEEIRAGLMKNKEIAKNYMKGVWNDELENKMWNFDKNERNKKNKYYPVGNTMYRIDKENAEFNNSRGCEADLENDEDIRRSVSNKRRHYLCDNVNGEVNNHNCVINQDIKEINDRKNHSKLSHDQSKLSSISKMRVQDKSSSMNLWGGGKKTSSGNLDQNGKVAGMDGTGFYETGYMNDTKRQLTA